jgi:hypothetical protein
MSKHNRDRRDRKKNERRKGLGTQGKPPFAGREARREEPNPFTRPLSERRVVVPGKDIPSTLEAVLDAHQRGDVVQMTREAFEDVFTPEVNASLDAFDPTILDFSSLSSPEALSYSEDARIVVRTYLDELQRDFRDYRQEADLGQPIASVIFDLRHEFARKSALEFYPDKEGIILGQHEESSSVPNSIPVFWHVRPMPEAMPVTRMSGLYPVVVFGPTTVVIQLPIPA